MRFEYYVLNYDWNRKKIYQFNVFQNCKVQEWSEQAVKKYLRAPSKYKYIRQYSNPVIGTEEIAVYGFDGLCEEIKSILKNKLWSRREYEVSVSDAFVTEISDILRDIDKYNSFEELRDELIKKDKRNPKLEKWDCYQQCELNIPMITREIIWQYKKQLKEER
mgnify:CR=1 FL=1